MDMSSDSCRWRYFNSNANMGYVKASKVAPFDLVKYSYYSIILLPKLFVAVRPSTIKSSYRRNNLEYDTEIRIGNVA